MWILYCVFALFQKCQGAKKYSKCSLKRFSWTLSSYMGQWFKVLYQILCFLLSIQKAIMHQWAWFRASNSQQWSVKTIVFTFSWLLVAGCPAKTVVVLPALFIVEACSLRGYLFWGFRPRGGGFCQLNTIVCKTKYCCTDFVKMLFFLFPHLLHYHYGNLSLNLQ